MNSQKECTISYYRTEFDNSQTLQSVFKKCLSNLPTTVDTRVDLRHAEAEIRHRKPSKKALVLHVATWTEGERASTVLHSADVEQGDLGSEPPGDNWDYLDGEGFLCIKENHCLILANGIHPNSIFQYVRNLFRHDNKLPSESDSFVFVAVSNPQYIRQLYDQGIKKIDLNIGQYMTSAMHQHESESLSGTPKIAKAITNCIITNPRSRKQVEKAANLQGRLVLAIDQRKPGLKPEEMTKIIKDANLVDDYEDDIIITTKTNNLIKKGELILKKKVKIICNAKSLSFQHVSEEMINYLNELEDQGLLEE